MPLKDIYWVLTKISACDISEYTIATISLMLRACAYYDFWARDIEKIRDGVSARLNTMANYVTLIAKHAEISCKKEYVVDQSK